MLPAILTSRFGGAVLSALLMVMMISSSVPLPLLSGYLGDAMAEVQGEALTVWIPPRMIAGENYRGVVVVADTFDVARDVLLVSSSPAVLVPERVSIKAGLHQAIFDIRVKPQQILPAAAAASVSAVMTGDGAFGEARTALYERASVNNDTVRLLAFNSTSLSFARLVVLTGQPAVSGNDVTYTTTNTTTGAAAVDSSVMLVYPGGTANVTINGEAGYGIADIPLVAGANSISVFGRPGEPVTVTRMPVDPAITVRVEALSMVPAWTPEWGHQRSWILVDAERDGKPVRGGYREIIATSSNPDVLQVEKSMTICSLPCAIPVRGGHSEGSAQVGVHVRNVGGGTVDIAVVQPARYMATGADIANLAKKYITQRLGESGNFVINSTLLFSHTSEKAVSSAVTDGPVYGLVGHYAALAANYTVIEAAGNVTLLMPGQFSKKVPLVNPDVKYHMSSSSSGVPGQVEWSFFSGLMRGDTGRGSRALADDMPPATVVESASVGVGSSHAAISSFEVRLSEPVGPAELKGELTAITLPGAGIQLAAYLVNGTVRGYYHYSAENRGVLTGALPSFSVPDQLYLQQIQSEPQLQVQVPPIVYPAEGFVFAAHIARGDGVPLQKVEPLYELGRADPGRTGEVQEIDTVFIHPGFRQAARVTVSAVMNAIDLDVVWPKVLKLDRPNEVTVLTSVPDARIQVSGDVRGTFSAGTGTGTGTAIITLHPAGGEGDRKVVVAASKAGWTATAVEEVIPAKRYVNVTINAVDRDGAVVFAPFTLEYETIEGASEMVEGTTPYTFDARPFASEPALVFGTAAAETEGTGGSSSYVHRFTQERESGVFTGIFERQTRFTVIDGAGSGYYLPGEVISLEADSDTQLLGFVLVEKFSHWEYDPDAVYMQDSAAREQDVFAGESDATITAVYIIDFSLLAVLVLSTAAAVGAYAYREEIRTILEAYRKRI